VSRTEKATLRLAAPEREYGGSCAARRRPPAQQGPPQAGPCHLLLVLACSERTTLLHRRQEALWTRGPSSWREGETERRREGRGGAKNAGAMPCTRGGDGAWGSVLWRTLARGQDSRRAGHPPRSPGLRPSASQPDLLPRCAPTCRMADDADRPPTKKGAILPRPRRVRTHPLLLQALPCPNFQTSQCAPPSSPCTAESY
jgi:hypothetical protein